MGLALVTCSPSVRRTEQPVSPEYVDLAYETRTTTNMDSMIHELLRMNQANSSLEVKRSLAIAYTMKKKLFQADSLYGLIMKLRIDSSSYYNIVQDYVMYWLARENVDSSLKYINLASDIAKALSKDWFSQYLKFQHLWTVHMFRQDCMAALAYLDSIEWLNAPDSSFRVANAENRVETLRNCSLWSSTPGN